MTSRIPFSECKLPCKRSWRLQNARSLSPRGSRLEQTRHAALEIEQFHHFLVAKSPVKDRQVILISDIRSSKHESHGRRVPTQSEIPVFNPSLQLAVEI